MARENQGLQIALIVFVMLSIILGVTTFIFYQQWTDAATKAEAATKEAGDQRAAAGVLAEESSKLKRQIGFAETDQAEAIDSQYKADMDEFGGNFPEDNRTYRALLGYLFQTIQEKDAKNDLLSEQLEQLKQDYAVREAGKDAQIKQLESARDAALQDLATRTQTFSTERKRITDAQAALQTQLAEARKRADEQLAEIQTNLDETLKEKQNLVTLNRQKSEKLDALVRESFEVAHGEIRWINQGNGTVWINLGRADSLGRQITFSVYPMDTTNLTKAIKKASIEVTQILGEHLAEARIIEDKVSDPIMPGDKIHTPIWTPGEQKRFALAGFMDINSDGKSDQHIIRNLITMNGAVVDCEIDETGNQRGQMTVDTRYLVLGKRPDEQGSAEVIAGYTAMRREADRLGIQTIPVRDLLQQMGWKDQTPVVRFGMGSNPADFRAKPPAGVPKVSSGTVSGLFKPRRPPREKSPGSGGGAY